jgi:hypothetical protein
MISPTIKCKNIEAQNNNFASVFVPFAAILEKKVYQ